MILLLVCAAALAAAEANPAKVDPQNYRIGSEDLLAVHVWKQPELSRRVTVRPDGKISLPLVNDVAAAGLTPNQLAQEVAAALKNFMTQADVAVIVEQVNSKKYYVMGEVARPGPYPLPAPTTVLQALAAAGGFREFANTKKIQVLKRSGRVIVDYRAVVEGKKPWQNVQLEAGDTVVVP